MINTDNKQRAFLLYNELLSAIVILDFQHKDVINHLKHIIARDLETEPQLREVMRSVLEIYDGE